MASCNLQKGIIGLQIADCKTQKNIRNGLGGYVAAFWLGHEPCAEGMSSVCCGKLVPSEGSAALGVGMVLSHRTCNHVRGPAERGNGKPLRKACQGASTPRSSPTAPPPLRTSRSFSTRCERRKERDTSISGRRQRRIGVSSATNCTRVSTRSSPTDSLRQASSCRTSSS